MSSTSEPDGTNINTNCGSTHIEVLQQYVKRNIWMWDLHMTEMRIGCIAVDHLGNVIDGDLILVYLRKISERDRKTGIIIRSSLLIMSNLGLYKACDREWYPVRKNSSRR